MNLDNLTKEERKAIKTGRAYRSWKKRMVLVFTISWTWLILGISLAHMGGVWGIIYTIGGIIAVLSQLTVLVFGCWKCPKCKAKLPKRSIHSGYEPLLVKTCPCCGFDLTEK